MSTRPNYIPPPTATAATPFIVFGEVEIANSDHVPKEDVTLAIGVSFSFFQQFNLRRRREQSCLISLSSALMNI